MSRAPAWSREDAVIGWVIDLLAAREVNHVILYADDLIAGRPVRKRGRPKLSEGARRAANPIHNAADKVPVIESLLHEHYPDQRTGVRERAVRIAAKRFNINYETLYNYVRRAKHDPRRISH
jgi:hypothetical protein